MQKYYVQKQANSQYLADVSLEQKDGFIEVYPDDSQVVKLMNFTDKCFLTDNNLIVVPDQVPMSQQEQDRQKNQNIIADLQAKHVEDVNKITNLTTQNEQHEQEINKLKTQAQISSQVTNSLIIKINSLGGNGQQTADDANKQAGGVNNG